MALLAHPARAGIHPFHAAMLAGAAPLFVGALLADGAYARSYQVEWSNFASWLLIGAMVPATIALVCAMVGWFAGRGDPAPAGAVGGGRRTLYVLVLAAAWAVGFLDALHHARDAWAIMPAAPILSLVAALLACIATWLGFSMLRGARVELAERAGGAA